MIKKMTDEETLDILVMEEMGQIVGGNMKDCTSADCGSVCCSQKALDATN